MTTELAWNFTRASNWSKYRSRLVPLPCWRRGRGALSLALSLILVVVAAIVVAVVVVLFLSLLSLSSFFASLTQKLNGNT